MSLSLKNCWSARAPLRWIAAFEGLKGALVLAVGFALLGYIHSDLESFCEDIVRNLHLNPARGLPRIFIETAGHVPDSQMHLLVAGAAIYAAVRFVAAPQNQTLPIVGCGAGFR